MPFTPTLSGFAHWSSVIVAQLVGVAQDQTVGHDSCVGLWRDKCTDVLACTDIEQYLNGEAGTVLVINGLVAM